MVVRHGTDAAFSVKPINSANFTIKDRITSSSFITCLKLTNRETSGNFQNYKVYYPFSQARPPFFNSIDTTEEPLIPQTEQSPTLRPLQSFESEQKIRILLPIS